MDACQTLASDFWVAGHRVTSTINLVAGRPVATRFEWESGPPKRMSRNFVRAYRKQRDQALQRLVDQIQDSLAICDDLDRAPLLTVLRPGVPKVTERLSS